MTTNDSMREQLILKVLHERGIDPEITTAPAPNTIRRYFTTRELWQLCVDLSRETMPTYVFKDMTPEEAAELNEKLRNATAGTPVIGPAPEAVFYEYVAGKSGTSYLANVEVEVEKR